MRLYLIEPEPKLSTRLKRSREAQVVGWSDSLVAVGSFPEHDFILVSAVFQASDILGFLSKRRSLASHTVIVEIQEQPDDVLPFLEAGAGGYVRRDASATELVETLREIRSGKPPLAPPVGDALLNRMHELLVLKRQRNAELLAEDCDALEALTARERQVLNLVRDGASNQEIANELSIELGTVKNHVHNILKKLNVTRREQAAQYVTLVEQIR